MSKKQVRIIEKPDCVSWGEIHEVLWKAHEKNRERGIFMRYPSLSGEEIRERIEGKGKMYVAVSNGEIVGTGAVVVRDWLLWCGKGQYAYFCFQSVLPDFQGNGIYKDLCQRSEQEARNMGLSRILMDTNENNKRVLDIAKKNNYKVVSLKFYKDHYNVVMVKWLDGCPYLGWYCDMQFIVHKWYWKQRHKLGCVKSWYLSICRRKL